MAEDLDSKLKEYIKKAQKRGSSKGEIKNSLLKVGYDTGIIDKSFMSVSKGKKLKNTLLILLIVILVIGFIIVLNNYFNLKKLQRENVILKEQLLPQKYVPPIISPSLEKFNQTNKSILLMSWNLPLEAKQNELINLTTIWTMQDEVTKDYGTIFSIINNKGDTVIRYFFKNNSYPTSSRRKGYTYVETYSFNAPYLKPDMYYYRIGIWDASEKIFFYSYNGTILGNITIKENPNIKVCGLTVVFISQSSPAEKAGVNVNDVIVGINGKKLEFENVKAGSSFSTYLFGDKVLNLEEFELNSEGASYKIVKKAGDRTGLRLRYKFCDIS